MEDPDCLHKPVKLQPSEAASFPSKLFYCWAPPLFYKHYRKRIEEEYYVPLKSHKSDGLGNKFESTWTNECHTRANPNLWHVILKIFYLEWIALGFLFLFSEFILKMSQPWLIGKLMSYHISTTNEVSDEQYYFYGTLVVMANFCSVTVGHFYQLKIQHLGMKIRIGCCSLVYRKALKTSKTSDGNTGNILNLLSNDVNRFDLAPMHILQLLVAPLETIFIIYFMYVSLGPTSITGIILLVLFIPTQFYLGKLTTKYRKQTAEKTDERIKLMDEIINGIQVIKMFTWENLFRKTILKARKLEVWQITKVSFIRAFNSSAMLFLNRTGIFLCILTYAITEQEINAEYVFVVSSFYAILRQTLTVYFPFGYQNFCETNVSIKRINNFLTSNENIQKSQQYSTFVKTSEERSLIKSSHYESFEPKSVGLYFEKASVKWNQSSEYVFQNVNLELSANELVVVTGPVGTGKSTLLHTILKELTLSEGKLTVVGKISYASQEPWLFSGTVRQNILFGSKFDSNKYANIVKICQLEKDFLALTYGDKTLVGEEGKLLSGGQKSRVNLARALYKDADIYLMDDPLAAVDSKVCEKIFEECILGYLKDKCRILVTHQSGYIIGSANRIYVLDKGELREDNNHKQTDITTDETDNEDPAVAATIINHEHVKSSEVNTKPSEVNTTHKKSKRVYRKYAQAGGSNFTKLFLFFLFVVTQVAASGADYFAAFWSNLYEKNSSGDVFNICIYIYVAIIVIVLFLSTSRSLVFFRYCMKASSNLHKQMFESIIKAPLLFFQTTPAGTILNRFSKDVGLIDETLPLLLMDTLQIAFVVLGSIILVSLVNPWMLLPTALSFALFYMFKTRFLRRSRNMKRLEAEARSPIYSHMHATLRGLTTIRTFNVQGLLKDEFDHHQDLHSSAFYMFMTCNRAFGFWLDMTCVFYSTIAIIAIMLTDTSAGNVGLSVTQAINLIGVLQWGIRQWSASENQMINVERIIEYTKIASEKDAPSFQQFEDWPSKGEIEFASVSLKHSNCLCLDDINLIIKAKEKVGVVGRTGAGKTSLVSTLFRLHPIEGNVFIDDINIENISLTSLRSKISIIPQEPILFTGTLRDNIDPNQEFEDHAIWRVLEQVKLKNAISSLNNEILSRGCNFSVGQKQLICLARAILRNNKIIVMDEATANIDSETDYSIRQAIKESFQDCTIITVAHRLNNIMESDRVIIMEDGKVVEFDSPDNLKKNSKSVFSQLVREHEKTVEHLEQQITSPN